MARVSQLGATLGILDFGRGTKTYAVSSASSTVGEGASLTFTVNTEFVASGTTLYWTINNDTTANADFSAVSGSFTITNNTGSFNITTVADVTTEGDQTFTVSVRTGSISGTVVATSSTITISDTSKAPTYTFTTVPSSINEGATGTFEITTTDVANGTTLYWTINHTTTVAADFSAVSGSFTVNSSTGSFSVTTVADTTTEGDQTFTVSIRTGSITGTVVTTSATVTVVDTSKTPTYTFTTTPANINEGANGTFVVTTTDVADATTLYWTINNTTTAAADFTATSGSFTITSGTGTFDVGITADATTEGAQTFTVSIRTVSTSGTIVATSSSITINDTSLTPIATFTSTPTSIDEGSSGTFAVSLANFDSGTLYWTTAHNTTAAADFQSNSGSFTVTGSTGSFIVTALADSTTEGAQTFTVQVRRNSTSGEVIGTSASVTINDTSLTPTGQYMLEGTDNFTTTAGYNEFIWTVPTGVTSVSAVCIGGGGGATWEQASIFAQGGGMGGGGGGALSYETFQVTPGEKYYVRAGHGASGTNGLTTNYSGGTSSIVRFADNTVMLSAGGGGGGTRNTTSNAVLAGGAGGTATGGTVNRTGGAGGAGVNNNKTSTGTAFRAGGGGAAGYSGNGGRGGNAIGVATTTSNIQNPTSVAGGGGGGGGGKTLTGGAVSAVSTTDNFAAKGGGTSPYGEGSSGSIGANSPGTVAGSATEGGGGGGNYTYGGGGAAIYNNSGGYRGVVRIIWGANRAYPSTNTADM